MRVTYVLCMFFGLLLASPINAAVLLQVKEHTDPGVVVRVSGTLDLTGLGSPIRQRLEYQTAPLMTPNEGYIGAGLPGFNSSNLFADTYQGVFTNPVDSFGMGGQADHWSNSTVPGFFAIAMARNALMLPAGYQSNSVINAYTDYVGAPGFTLQSLGIGVGTFNFDLINGERVTVEIAPVPLPATASLLGLGLLALVAAGRSARTHGQRLSAA